MRGAAPIGRSGAEEQLLPDSSRALRNFWPQEKASPRSAARRKSNGLLNPTAEDTLIVGAIAAVTCCPPTNKGSGPLGLR